MSSIIRTVLKYAAVGALISVIPWVAGLICFGTRPTSSGGDRGWAIIMVPIFAFIGAIVGAMNGLIVSVWRRYKR
jgi:ABC-type xylose transport system permease subunit